MRRSWIAAGILCFCAAFLIGTGLGEMLVGYQRSQRYIPTVPVIENAGEVLSGILGSVSIEKELHANTNGRCEARIQNMKENTSSARVRIIRQATGEVLYQSGIIDPGYYVEYIHLDMRLKEGYYPCSVIWEFYDPQTQKSDGKASQSAVLIVQSNF